MKYKFLKNADIYWGGMVKLLELFDEAYMIKFLQSEKDFLDLIIDNIRKAVKKCSNNLYSTLSCLSILFAHLRNLYFFIFCVFSII